MVELLKQARRVADEVLESLTGRYLNSDGLVSATFPPSHRNLLADFDDYIPFVLYYGLQDFALGQIGAARSRLRHGLPLRSGRVISFFCDEFVGGLVSIVRATDDNESRSALSDAVSAVRNCLVRDGFLCAIHYVTPGLTFPVACARGGALAEVFAESEDVIPGGADDAISWLQGFVDSDDFRLTGLFPDRIFIHSRRLQNFSRNVSVKLPRRIIAPFKPGPRGWVGDALYLLPFAWEAQTVKGNTNTIHALITLARKTELEWPVNAIRTWVAAMDGRCTDGVLNQFQGIRGSWGPRSLAVHHPVVDALCDYYMLVEKNEVALGLAVRIAEAWLNKRLANDSFPEYDGGAYAFLDDQVDFSISLMRLAEITGEQRYLDEAESTLHAALKLFPVKGGLISRVSESGDTDSGRIEPKFNALFLKVPIILEAGCRLYQDTKVHDLMKDR